MAGAFGIFSMYKLRNEDKYYVIRTVLPGYSNASQNQEYLANTIEQSKRKMMLDFIAKKHEAGKGDFIFVGEMQSYPVGEQLYAANGNVALKIYFMETAFGHPWIILGTASSETDFLTALHEDEELLALQPVGRPTQETALFLTENDVDLSAMDRLV
jgi:hypothetical protein